MLMKESIRSRLVVCGITALDITSFYKVEDIVPLTFEKEGEIGANEL